MLGLLIFIKLISENLIFIFYVILVNNSKKFHSIKLKNSIPQLNIILYMNKIKIISLFLIR
jgi:hypothetical protein